VATVVVPRIEDDEEPWPTLGFAVVDWIEANLVFGPGDLRGEPARVDIEKRGLLARMYEVYPRGHPQEGRRRFKRVALSLRKATAKTELAAWIAACELHPDAPVRTAGWDGHGQPEGGGVTDPYIPMVAVSEEQSEELAYGALRIILQFSRVAKDFDIGLERIMRASGDGKAVALASSPNARDGARTTLNVFDETHRHVLPHLKAAHRTMLANIPKRMGSDAWSFEITTSYLPGENSVAEDTHEYAKAVADGRVKDSRLFFFHRQASDDRRLTDDNGDIDRELVKAAVIEASGPAASWSDIDGIADQFLDPTADLAYLRRVWLNQPVQSAQRAFSVDRWRQLARPREVQPGAKIAIGFDGARYHDATALIATEILTGYQWVLGIWERPAGLQTWEVPEHEVETVLAEAMTTYDVWRVYADPPYWETHVAKWAGEYGEERLWTWRTNRMTPMAYAIRSYESALASGELTHDGNPLFARHIGNACRRMLAIRDDQGQAMHVIQKERPDSPSKIDAAMASVLSWQARCDALAANVGEGSVYEERGILVFG
jgi:phage terminase large subunit-like protein